MNQSNTDKFSLALRDHNWDHVIHNNDAQSAYSSFLNDYTSMYNACFPLRFVKIGYKNRKSWLSEELKKNDQNQKQFVPEAKKISKC